MPRPPASMPHVPPISPAAASSDAVFLSPRIVDKTAFDELAGTLRTLIDDAAAAGRDLKTAAADANRTATQLEQASPRADALLLAITGAASLLDSRFAETLSLLTQATDRTDAAARFERQLDEILVARFATLQQQLATAEAGARARLESSVPGARLTQISQRTAELETRIAELARKLDSLAAQRPQTPPPAPPSASESAAAQHIEAKPPAKERAPLAGAPRVRPTPR